MSMALSWHKAVTGWTDHYKIRRLRRRMGVSQLEATGIVARLWDYVAEHCENGVITHVADDLPDAIGLELTPEDLVEALSDVGLVDIDDGLVAIHGWRDHHEKIFDKRKAMKEFRERKKAEREAQKSREENRSDNVPERLQHRSGTDMEPCAYGDGDGDGDGDGVLRLNTGRTRKLRLGNSAEDCSTRLEQATDDERAIWTHWLKVTRRTSRMRYSADRAKRVAKQATARPVEDTIRGLDKLAASSHHAGHNPQRTRYDDWLVRPLCNPGAFDSWCEEPREVAPASPPDELDFAAIEAEAARATAEGRRL